MTTKNIFGDDYEVISTELAKKTIDGEMSLDEAKNNIGPFPNGEPIWWEVVSDLPMGLALWMNNMDGEIILLSIFGESYYRTF